MAEAGAPSGANPAHSRTRPPLSEAMPGSLLHLSPNSVHVPSLSPRKTPFAPTLCRGESRRILSTSSIHRLSNFERNRTHAPLARGWQHRIVMEITRACALPSRQRCVRAGDSDCGRGAGELFPSLFIILERFTLVTNSHMNFMLCFFFFFIIENSWGGKIVSCFSLWAKEEKAQFFGEAL